MSTTPPCVSLFATNTQEEEISVFLFIKFHIHQHFFSCNRKKEKEIKSKLTNFYKQGRNLQIHGFILLSQSLLQSNSFTIAYHHTFSRLYKFNQADY